MNLQKSSETVYRILKPGIKFRLDETSADMMARNRPRLPIAPHWRVKACFDRRSKVKASHFP